MIQFGSITFIADRSGDLHQLRSTPVRPRIIMEPSTTPERSTSLDRRQGPAPLQRPPTPRQAPARRHEAPAPRQNLPPRHVESDRAPRGHRDSGARTVRRVSIRAGSMSTMPARAEPATTPASAPTRHTALSTSPTQIWTRISREPRPGSPRNPSRDPRRAHPSGSTP